MIEQDAIPLRDALRTIDEWVTSLELELQLDPDRGLEIDGARLIGNDQVLARSVLAIEAQLEGLKGIMLEIAGFLTRIEEKGLLD